MKQGFLKLARTVIAPVALVAAMAFMPAGVFAQNRGGEHERGHQGGSNRGHSFSAPSRGNFGGSVNRRNGYGGGENFAYRHFDRDRGERFGGYYRPGFGVGIYAPYRYSAPVCNPAGFYDQYGNWQYYPGCAVPYGY